MSATDSSTNSSVKNAPERAVRLTRENSGTSSPWAGPGSAVEQGGHRHGLGRSGLDDAVEFAKIEQPRGILLQRERYDRACLEPGPRAATTVTYSQPAAQGWAARCPDVGSGTAQVAAASTPISLRSRSASRAWKAP